jgi:hypothetical protein
MSHYRRATERDLEDEFGRFGKITQISKCTGKGRPDHFAAGTARRTSLPVQR